MKKIVTTIFSFVAVAACAIGLAACKKDNKEERTVEVTEEQWKAAVSYFGNDKETVDISERNFTITYKYTNNGVVKIDDTYKFDSSNKIIQLLTAGDYSKGDDIDIWSNESYMWEQDGKLTIYEKEESTGYNTTESKELVDFFENIDEALLEYPSYFYLTEILTEYDVANKYSEFTFDAEKEAYCCAELKASESDYVYNTEIYFENGKLIKLYVTFTAETNGVKENVVYECTASYGGVKITIPQNIKDMPLSEE